MARQELHDSMRPRLTGQSAVIYGRMLDMLPLEEQPEPSDLDAQSAFCRQSHKPPREGYAFSHLYLRPNDRVVPLRLTDSQADPSRNDVEDAMVAFLDGDDQDRDNHRDDSWLTQYAEDDNGDEFDPWNFDTKRFELCGIEAGMPLLRPRSVPNKPPPHRPAKKSRRKQPVAQAATPVAQAAAPPVAPRPVAPPSPLSWSGVMLPGIVPRQ